jgi:hypothetical protein
MNRIMIADLNPANRIDGEVAAFFAAMNPEKMAAFRPSVESQSRLNLLLDKHKETQLTPDETAELEHTLVVNRIVSLAKARALTLLKA